jgi:hypothetical protein
MVLREVVFFLISRRALSRVGKVIAMLFRKIKK